MEERNRQTDRKVRLTGKIEGNIVRRDRLNNMRQTDRIDRQTDRIDRRHTDRRQRQKRHTGKIDQQTGNICR